MADRGFHCDDITCFVAHRDQATKCLTSHEPERYGFAGDDGRLLCPKHLPRHKPDKKPHWRWPKTRTTDDAAVVKHMKAARSALNAAAGTPT